MKSGQQKKVTKEDESKFRKQEIEGKELDKKS